MSEPTMTPDLEQRLRDRLQVRSERLAKIVALNGPPSVVALMAEHVTTTAILLLGEKFSDAVFRKLLISLRENSGICMCGLGEKVPTEGLCAACVAECEADDRELDQALAMDAPAKGQVS